MERFYEMFVAQMDSIYFEGYVAETACSNPSKLQFEWEEFIHLIS